MKKLLLIAIVFISRFVIDGFILPSWAISPVNYTRLTQDRGEWAEVVQRILDEDFEEAARLAKNLTSKTPEVTFLKGFLAYQAGNYAEALEKFGQIQDSFASLREFILFYMALCAKELENLPKMNALFHQIFQEYPDSALTPLYQQTLLEHLMALGKYQEALNFVEHLEPQKNSPFALWLQHTNADLYERLDQPTKAFEMYLQLWIEYPLEDVGRTDQDWRRLAQKVKRQPTPEQFFTRIENIMKKGRYDIALEELQAMRKVYPELDVVMEARWHLVKGECLYESKQDELAIEHLQKIEDRELLPEALYYLQLTYFRRTEQPKYARLFEQTAAILINYPREKSKTWRERSLQKLAKHFEADPPVDYARSIAISQQLVNEHPNSIYAPEAK
jgi:tetratricopeptide (TPR) repeat protein